MALRTILDGNTAGSRIILVRFEGTERFHNSPLGPHALHVELVEACPFPNILLVAIAGLLLLVYRTRMLEIDRIQSRLGDACSRALAGQAKLDDLKAELEQAGIELVPRDRTAWDQTEWVGVSPQYGVPLASADFLVEVELDEQRRVSKCGVKLRPRSL